MPLIFDDVDSSSEFNIEHELRRGRDVLRAWLRAHPAVGRCYRDFIDAERMRGGARDLGVCSAGSCLGDTGPLSLTAKLGGGHRSRKEERGDEMDEGIGCVWWLGFTVAKQQKTTCVLGSCISLNGWRLILIGVQTLEGSIISH